LRHDIGGLPGCPRAPRTLRHRELTNLGEVSDARRVVLLGAARPARVTTFGEQKAANPLLAAPDEDAFGRRLLASLGLLAYSTISQVGYLLMAVAVATRSSTAPRSLLFYLAASAVTNLAAFAVVTELPHARTVASYRGLAARHPGLAAVLVVSLLGLVGTPRPVRLVGDLCADSGRAFPDSRVTSAGDETP
jgi:hypothetical protein